MDPVFAKAIRAPEARIVCLGLELKPLTLGHLFLLLETDNAFPDYANQADWQDLVPAVLICSQRSHTRARRMLKSPFRKMGYKLWGRLNQKAFLVHQLTDAQIVFQKYLGEQLAMPQMDKVSSGGGDSCGLRAPLAWRILAMLMADFGMNEAQALRQRVPFAIALWATEADRRGTSRLADDRQILFRKVVEQKERERIAREGGGNPS